MLKRLAQERIQAATQYAGSLLALLAVVTFGYSYVYLSKTAPTALIPGVWGILFLAFAQLAKKEEYKKAAMHTVSIVALLGILLPLSRLIMNIVAIVTSKIVLTHASIVGLTSLSIMIVVCGFILGLCIYSFIIVRREKSLK